jgi:hypothetical protein
VSCGDKVVRGGVAELLAPSSPGSVTSAPADAIWMKDGPVLRRFVVTEDGGVRQQAEGTVSVDSLHGGDLEAIGTFDGGLVHFGVDAGVIELRNARWISDTYVLGAERRGDLVITSGMHRIETTTSSSEWVGEICTLPMSSGALSTDSPSCTTFANNPAGMSDEGVWLSPQQFVSYAAASFVATTSSRTTELQLVRFRPDGGLGQSDSLLFPRFYEVVLAYPFQAHSVPWLVVPGSSDVLVPRLDETGALVIEQFSPGAQVTSVSDDWVCGRNGAQTVCQQR